MAVTVKKITLWRTETQDRVGLLANVLEPLANARADLQVCMGYRLSGDSNRAAIEVAPITGSKATAAARSAGLAPSSIPTLQVTGDNRPGLGHAMASAVADAGIGMNFLVAQVIGRKYSAIVGFANDDDAKKATPLIKKAAAKK
jgi:hypothetical protein